MNVKKALLVTLSAGLIATTLVNTNYVSAEDGDAINDSEGSSKATVGFKFNESSPELLDPENPEQKLSENEKEKANEREEVTNNAGPLSLDYVSNIDFGDQKVDIHGGDYNARIDSNDASKITYLQVTDQRSSSNGWKVMASAESFKNKMGEDSLPAATITLKDGEVKSNSDTFSPPKIVTDEIIITTDEKSVPIVHSEGKKDDDVYGLGSWIIKWYNQKPDTYENENVILTVPPGAATEGKHSTTINWTLSDGPFVNEDEE